VPIHSNELVGEHEWRRRAALAIGGSNLGRTARNQLVDPLGAYLPIQNMLVDGMMATLLRL
jgi:hypothetical protein